MEPILHTCPRCKGAGKIRPNVLRDLRIAKGKTQADIADMLGIKQPAYARQEAINLPSWKHRRALCEFYKVTADQLLGRVAMPAARPKVPRSVKVRQAAMPKPRGGRAPAARVRRRPV
jgi:transcriptional regulator with XRE-family HTH domain